jgi:Zn-dependent protease with chaperone function
MLFEAYVHPALLAILCLLPAASRWWSGRALLPLLDDPVLPERLQAHRRRNFNVMWAVLVGIVLLGSVKALFWSVPLVVFARIVAGYPFRCALYDERWSLPAYVAWMARLWLAAYSFWLLVAATPFVAHGAGSLDWLVALVLGAILIVWNIRSADVFRWLLRSEPLADGPLLERFQSIASASRAPGPRFELVDLRGGALANAVALPSLRGSSVVYTDTLLRLLDADEAAAITAHEIAHLEHFDATRLRRLSQITSALILSASAVGLLPRVVPGLSLLILAVLWLAGLVVALAWMARDRQRNETASDVRAVELSGNSDALIRALTKVYTFSRVPRRVDTQMERMATHPSLARRIRSIREAAGAPLMPALQEPETVHGADGKTVIAFEADRLQWQESAGVTYVLSYAHLSELRVVAPAAGAARLVALESGGRRWDVALEAAEAARTQAILDRVDVRLGEPVVQRPSFPFLQVAGAGVAICAVWAGHVVVAFIALAASLRSAAAFAAAAGGAALAGAALGGRQALATGDGSSAWPALLLAVFGATLLAGAWRRREDAVSRGVNAGIAGLALLVLVSLALIAMRGTSAVGLYQASLAIPGGAILPFALAGAVACMPRRGWRLVAIPLALVGLMVALAGSSSFLYAFGRDPFLVNARSLPIETLEGAPSADFTVPGPASDLRLSPGGRRVAVMRHVGVVGVSTGFSVGRPGSEFAQVAATDLLFLDDERILTLSVDGTDTLVREMTVQPAPAVVWAERLQNLQSGRLAYRSASDRWLVTGTTLEGNLASVESAVGRRGVRRREWSLDEAPGWSDAWAIQGETVLTARKEFPFDPTDGDALGLMLKMMFDQMPTRLTRITPAGAADVATSQLDTSCTDRALDAERLVCLAFDGSRTQFFAVEPRSGTLAPIGSIAGHFVSHRPTRAGWVSGWIDAHGWIDPRQLAVDVVGGRAIAAPRGAGEFTAVGRVAGTLTYGGASTRVRLYRLNER